MRLFALLLLTVAACGGSPKPAATTPPPAPDPIPKTAGPKCDVVADKLAIVIHADKPDAQASAKTDIRARCSQDNWSDEARNCFATVESDAELDGCKQHLDATQKAGFAKVAPGSDAWDGAAGSAPAPAAAPAAEAPKPKAKPRTRGAQPKGDSSDPQEGGE
jgi:hypothetical protein